MNHKFIRKKDLTSHQSNMITGNCLFTDFNDIGSGTRKTEGAFAKSQ